MLPVVTNGDRGPQIILLHWLGGSARTWDSVSQQLAVAGFRCAALDLPGFGAATSFAIFNVESVVAKIVETIRWLRKNDAERPWLLVGHSMGGKFALLVARAAMDGAEGLQHLAGLILVSPSPPSPEPMSESKRSDLLESLGRTTGEPHTDRKHARKFLDDNTGKLPLGEVIREGAEDDLLRMNRHAFSAWLTRGSKEDCADQVGVLSLPTLVFAGTEDADLGPDAQAKWTLPHLASGSVVRLKGGSHLAPLERPSEVADRIAQFVEQLGLDLEPLHKELAPAFRALMESQLTSPQTRAVMHSRLCENLSDTTRPFSPEHHLILRALVRRIVPDAGFDIAARVIAGLTTGAQDGWRFDALPDDWSAWTRGLTSLDHAALRKHEVPFIALDPELQDDLLNQARDGSLGNKLLNLLHIGKNSDTLDAAQMQLWFEDVRGSIAKLYMADPRTMQRIGFHGFADEAGFSKIRLEERETSQP